MHVNLPQQLSIALLLAVAGAVTLLGGLPAPRVSAAAFTVTKTADTNDGACDSDCSLREAVVAANALAGHDNIAIPAGTYTLTGAIGENASASGDLNVTDSVSFNGTAMLTTIINGGNLEDAIQVLGGATSLILTDLTVTNAASDGVEATVADVNLSNVAITDNGANGIVTTTGNVSIDRSVIDGNTLSGILTDSGIVIVTRSTISRNAGDGVFTSNGNVQTVNSTISTNTSDGITTADGDITVNSSTIAFNGQYGLAIRETGTITVNSSIISNNTTADCSTSVETSDYSLDSDDSCSLGGTDISEGLANLGPLQNNGGTTETHALLTGSQAIDAAATNCPEDDQRGEARPQGLACDMGAYEGVAAAPTATATAVKLKTHTPTATATAAATSTPLPATTTNTPAPVSTSRPQGGQGGIVRGPDTGSGGSGGSGSGAGWGIVALAVVGAIALSAGLWRRRA